MILAEWAGAQGIHPQTAYRCFPQGRLPVEVRRVGALSMVENLSSDDRAPIGKTAVCRRVVGRRVGRPLFRSDGGVFAFADANFYGSMGGYGVVF